METNCLVKPSKRPVAWCEIKLLLLDCDGVLTDGRIIYGKQGQELKNFSAHDGMGFMLLKYTDVVIGIITGRSSEALQRRCEDLHIKHLHQNVRNKLLCLDELLTTLHLDYKNVAYMGDDWNDIPVMRKVAFSATPADAQPDIQKIADWVAPHNGGHGAVRDLINHILIHKGIYEKTVKQYIEDIS
ncbi:MAG: HAD-IIIA family hydrolase [Candidatus Cloacimonetes bacterium]|nr:HAD-IIIA family hydrolase [Candidatus Cloacimonadota bacterium]